MPSAPVTHIASVRYKNVADAPEAARRFQALLTECKLHDGKPYITSLTAGSNVSPEGASKGIQLCGRLHMFILVFPDVEARDYYLHVDPVHQEFKKFIRPLIEDKFIFDFVDGSFDITS
ncbi:hypothetical protein JAAARDRAFT_200589 [Jaapia argillacea MUCL 33604]|uniref:Stress-response A/B barrel domain-containing protein n=1 Tax=Jaapia argillacea MUCL 33604 TaxID=933084 RepID=A0A067PH09_9AGAM|nr:hypothetical protein JAAARDRAFT_200589 [Jaapia argillacea MUCL 33604]